MKPRLAVLILLALSGTASFADDAIKVSTELLEQARAKIAGNKGVKPEDLAVDKPLAEQGFTEKDFVEAFLAIQEVFDVEIPDELVDAIPDSIHKATILQLAQIATQQREKKE
jgi:acyl carrier protein